MLLAKRKKEGQKGCNRSVAMLGEVVSHSADVDENGLGLGAALRAAVVQSNDSALVGLGSHDAARVLLENGVHAEVITHQDVLDAVDLHAGLHAGDVREGGDHRLDVGKREGESGRGGPC